MAPDLVVEVVSRDDLADDLQIKIEQWLRAGSQSVWVLHPETHAAMVYRSDGAVALMHADDTIAGEPVLRGFGYRLGDLF